MTYDALRDRDSSLTKIAGNYDDGTGNVLNITGDGTIFKQDAETSCVTNGLVLSIDKFFNEFTIEY